MFEVGKDVVVLTLGGKSYTALVLSERDGEVSHLGKNGEPLLTLAYVKGPADLPAWKKRGVTVPSEPEILIERDVVHASHEFSDQYRRDKGLKTPAQIVAQRGHGEWRRLVTLVDEPADKQAADQSQTQSE